MPQKRHLRLMLASAALLAFSGQAFALDGADMITKLNAAYAQSGGSIEYQSLATNGTTVTLTGASFKVGNGAGESFAIGDLVFDGVEETEGGGYYAESVTLPDINRAEKDGTVSIADIAIGGLTIPANPAGGTINDIIMYETASTGPVAITAKGKPLLSIDSSEASLTRQDNDAGFDFDSTVSGIKVDLSQVDDAKSRDALDKLGIRSLDGAITMEGAWELASGNMALSEFAFDFNDIGRLNIAMDLSGYTMDFVKAMQEAIKASEANPNKEQANQAFGLSMLGLMQQLTFNSAEIRFDDATITKRILDYVGSQQGVTGEQMAQSIKGLVPIALAQLNIPELQNQVSEAVNTYLDDPKSLTINAEPQNPVPIPMIVGAGMGAPNTLPALLGVTVSAND